MNAQHGSRKIVVYVVLRYWPDGRMECRGTFFEKEFAQHEKRNWDGVVGAYVSILKVEIPFATDDPAVTISATRFGQSQSPEPV